MELEDDVFPSSELEIATIFWTASYYSFPPKLTTSKLKRTILSKQ